MTLKMPYMRDSELSGLQDGSGVLPRYSFCVKPANYRVVDGDTIAIVQGRDGIKPGQTAFRIRFHAVNAPEMPIVGREFYEMLKQNVNIHEGNYGMQAKLALQALCKGRALFVCPYEPHLGFQSDKHKRLLADICVSGGVGTFFEPINSSSLQYEMLQSGHVRLLEDQRYPNHVPEELSQLTREFINLSFTQKSDTPGP